MPLPERPSTLDIAADVILRQLPVPGPELGGDWLLTRLRDVYGHFGLRS